MSKSLLHKLFGAGRIPKKMRPAFEAEGIVLLDEGLRTSVVLRGFRAPGRYSSYRKSWVTGSLVLTGMRFAAFAYSKPLVNVPPHGELLSKLELGLEGQETLIIAFDPGDFHNDRSGWVQCNFATPLATAFYERLKGI